MPTTAKKRAKAGYMISSVAELYKLHPQTLRLYERVGLLKPSRSQDRKSTRPNSSHGYTSYAVFCLKEHAEDSEDVVRLRERTLVLRSLVDAQGLGRETLRPRPVARSTGVAPPVREDPRLFVAVRAG